MEVLELQRKAIEIRLAVLRLASRAGAGFFGSCMSVLDILVALYYGSLGHLPVLRFDKVRPRSDKQDFVVLGKGQAALVLYAILADLGFFGVEELDHYLASGSFLQIYPNLKVPGVAAPVSRQGQGLGLALGMALSVRLQKGENRVFCILGDGELQAGTLWESVLVASQYKLNNLFVLIDGNGLQVDGNLRAVVDIGSVQDKFESFGWKVIQVRDGHDFDQILNSFQKGFVYAKQPVCIWAHTTVAKGIPFAEGKVSYLSGVLSAQEFIEAEKYLTSLL